MEVGGKAGEAAGLGDVGVVAVGAVAVEADPRFVAKLPQRHAAAAGEPVAGADDDLYFERGDGEELEIAARGDLLAGQEAEVGAVRAQGGELAVERLVGELDLDARVARAEFGNRGGDEVGGEAPIVADDELAAGAAGGVLDGGDGEIDLGEDLAGVDVEGAAGVGELDADAVAIEEPGAELLLEGADLAAERGLGDVQPLGGAAEVQLLRHRLKIAQVAQFHARKPKRCRAVDERRRRRANG